MFSENSNCRECGYVPKTLHTISQRGFLKTKNSADQKRLFGKNWNLACRVVLSIYTFYAIFKQIWAWHRSSPSHLKGIFSDSNNIFLWYEIRTYKQKKLISKISVDSNFTFSSYAWLCVFHCSHRLLCWIKSRVRDFSVKIALISYWNNFSPTPVGKCTSYRSAPQICKKIHILKILRVPSIWHQWVCLNRQGHLITKNSLPKI